MPESILSSLALICLLNCLLACFCLFFVCLFIFLLNLLNHSSPEIMSEKKKIQNVNPAKGQKKSNNKKEECNFKEWKSVSQGCINIFQGMFYSFLQI